MSVHGGDLAIGTDKRGTPTGAVSPAEAELFNEAKLRPMLLTWLPASLEIRSQDHEIDGKLISRLTNAGPVIRGDCQTSSRCSGSGPPLGPHLPASQHSSAAL